MSGPQGTKAGASSGTQHAPVGDGKASNRKGKATYPITLSYNGFSNQDPKTATAENAAQEDRAEETSGQPGEPLTATNLDKLGQQQQPEWQNATDDEEVESYNPPPATTDERLEQARIFLSDEDVNVNQEFATKHQEIDAYLRRISDEKIPCNARVYREVKSMLFVHKMRMDKQRYEGNRLIDYNRLPKHSQRLGLRDTSERASLRGAPLREDHPPFTIDRKLDQQEFLRAFRADTDEGRALRALEAADYEATLLDSSLVNEYLEERAAADETENDKTERFSVRARKRGRRRAAVQIALRSFARNCEQHFAGGWDHRVVRLPPPPVEEPAEPIMFAPLDREQRRRAIHPYRYTRRILQFQEAQRAMEEGFNETLANHSDDTDWYIWLDFPNPSHKWTVIRARYENRLKVLGLLTFDLLVKLGSQEILSEGDDATEATEARVFVEEWALPARLETGGDDLPQQTKVRLVLAFFSEDPGWPAEYLAARAKSRPLSPQAIAALQQYIESRSSIQNATVVGLTTGLGTELADVWSQLTNNRLAEDDSMNREAAIQTLSHIRNHRYKRDESKYRKRGKRAPLRELAQALDGNEAELTHGEAINLMSDRILNENHENERPQRVTLDEMWSFAAHVPTESRNRNFFSIDQWSGFPPIKAGEEARTAAAGKRKAGVDDDYLPLPPPKRQRADDIDGSLRRPQRQYHAVAYEPLNPDNPNPSRRLPPEEIGFVQVEETPQAHVPVVGSGELMPPEIKDFDYLRDGHVLENAPDMKEDHQEGPPFFPFAETPFMEVLLGRQIEDDMAPGSLAAAAQHIKADGTNIILPTQQFSLPQPAIDASADALNNAGVFNQRLPPSLKKRKRLPGSDPQRGYPTPSPSDDDDDDDDDDEDGRRGAKRQRTESPSRDEQRPTREHTGPHGTNGGSRDRHSSFSAKEHHAERTQQRTTEAGTSTGKIIFTSYIGRMLGLGQRIRSGNDNKQPMTEKTSNTETTIKTTTKTITDLPSTSNTETTTKTTTKITTDLSSESGLIEPEDGLPLPPSENRPSNKTTRMGTASPKSPAPGNQTRTQNLGVNFGTRPSRSPVPAAWLENIQNLVAVSTENEAAKAVKKEDGYTTEDEDLVQGSPEPEQESKPTLSGQADQTWTQDLGINFGNPQSQTPLSEAWLNGTRNPFTASTEEIKTTQTKSSTQTAPQRGGKIPAPPTNPFLAPPKNDLASVLNPPNGLRSKTSAPPRGPTGAPLNYDLSSMLNLPNGLGSKTSAPPTQSTGGPLNYDFSWKPGQPLVFGPQSPAGPARGTGVTSKYDFSRPLDRPRKFGPKASAPTTDSTDGGLKRDFKFLPGLPVTLGPHTPLAKLTESTGGGLKRDFSWKRGQPLIFGKKDESADEGEDEDIDYDDDGVSSGDVERDDDRDDDEDYLGFLDQLDQEEEELSSGEVEDDLSEDGKGKGKKKTPAKRRGGKGKGDKNYKPGNSDEGSET